MYLAVPVLGEVSLFNAFVVYESLNTCEIDTVTH